MSTNHFSTDLLEAPWWAQHRRYMMDTSVKASSNPNNTTSWANSQVYHSVNAANTAMFCTQNNGFSFNLNRDDDEELDEQLTDTQREGEEEGQYEEQEITPKEALFEKPLTPSDVGKLNRLVIPKQHAEKHFPMSSRNESVEKGLLLSFEDESGKSWRFRYSYWNSSQSYVLTKGWSRFVKEKRLDAGDVVLFERHRHDSDRLFIGWRRKGTPAATQAHDGGVAQPSTAAAGGAVGGGGGGGWTPVFYSGYPYPSHGSQLPYQPDYLHAGSVVRNQTASSGNSKRLRLFGVNLECLPDESSEYQPSTPDGSSSSMSTLHQQAPAHHHQYHYHHHHSKSHAYDHHN